MAVIPVQFRDYLTPSQVIDILKDMDTKGDIVKMAMVVIDKDGYTYTVAAGECSELDVAGMGGKLITYSNTGGNQE